MSTQSEPTADRMVGLVECQDNPAHKHHVGMFHHVAQHGGAFVYNVVCDGYVEGYTTEVMVFAAELGRDAHRAGLSAEVGDNPTLREVWNEVPHDSISRFMADYAAGWKADR